MSLIALPPTWRLCCLNQLGSSISNIPVGMPTVQGILTRFDAAGLVSFATVVTFFSTTQASIGNNSFVAGSTIVNTSAWLGGDFMVSVFASGNLSGSFQVFLEGSLDGGTTWPTPASANGAGGGFLVAAVGFGSTTTNSTASTTRRVGFNL